MSGDFRLLTSNLYGPTILVESGTDASRVNEVHETIVKHENGLARFMSRYVPNVQRFVNKGVYFVQRLGQRLGGQYNPRTDSLQINVDQSANFRDESVAHEKIHFYQKVGGAISTYWNVLTKNLGYLGAMLYRPIIEGGASYLTQLYRGVESRDAYGPYRAGAREVAREYGEGVLVNPPRDENKVLKIANTFFNGMMKYINRNPRLAYSLA